MKEPLKTGKALKKMQKLNQTTDLIKLNCLVLQMTQEFVLKVNWKPGVLSKRFLNNFKTHEAAFEKYYFQSIKKSGK